MFHSALLGSILLLAFAGLMAWLNPRPRMLSLIEVVACVAIVMVICAFFGDSLMAQGLLTVLAVGLLEAPKHGPRLFMAWALVAAGVSWGNTLRNIAKEQEEHARLRERYPIASLAERLPAMPAAAVPPPAEAAALDRFEAALARGNSGREERNEMLRRLHHDRLGLFVNSPQFGQRRMRYLSTGFLDDHIPRDDTPAAAPKSKEPPPVSSVGDRLALAAAHEAAALDFVNERGFGIVESRTSVTGFLSHRLGTRPRLPTGGTPVSVALVGLLLRPMPVVYVSEALPKMDEVKSTPTRALDRFEAKGLTALRAGEELHVGSGAEGTRMLGAIRCVQQCIVCHGGQRGDLLGAFSYDFGTPRANEPASTRERAR